MHCKKPSVNNRRLNYLSLNKGILLISALDLNRTLHSGTLDCNWNDWALKTIHRGTGMELFTSTNQVSDQEWRYQINILTGEMRRFGWDQLRWFSVLRFPPAHTFLAISARRCARACGTQRKRFLSRLDSEINARFLLNEHGDLHLLHCIIVVHILSSSIKES